MSGLSPWLVGPLTQKKYFMEVTDRRVLVHQGLKGQAARSGLGLG